MIGEDASGTALPPEVTQQIIAKTDGVPLFVEELTKMVMEAMKSIGSVASIGSVGSYNRTPLYSMAIPATLQDSLMARLDRLGPA
jgi:predicted ATPase